MFLRNDILNYKELSASFRILFIPSDSPYLIVIDILDPKAIPGKRLLQSVKDDIEKGLAILISGAKELHIVDDQNISNRDLQIRDRGWRCIDEIVKCEPDVYLDKPRAKLVKKSMLKNKVTNKKIYNALRRYWQRGQTPNCLLPDYQNCGGKGKERTIQPDVKLGRPRIYTEKEGINVDAGMKKIFQIGVDRYKANGSKFSLQRAFDDMCRDFFMEKIVSAEDGRVEHRYSGIYAEKGPPTVDQFTYWYEKNNNKLEDKKIRMTERKYNLSERGLLGTATAEVWGPGSRYLIDATLADVYLVSRLDRGKIIGRPVLYVVIDVFSRMIVGIYIGIEGPSWVAAMMALGNVVTDKKEFCARFGIALKDGEWPCNHLGAIILGDRGEIEGRTINSLIKNFNVTVENTPAYRADWKAVVEQRFRLLPAVFGPYVPGYIQSDYRVRGGTDYRLDGILDLDQFTRITIHSVLYYNNHVQLVEYDKDDDLAAAAIPYVPINLWNWGIEHRSGALRHFPADLVRISLLPAEKAKVTEYGIRVFNKYYSCGMAIEKGWFDLARQTKMWDVKISHDPRDNDVIYLHDESAALKFHECKLLSRSRDAEGYSLWESNAQETQDKKIAAEHKPAQQLGLANTTANIESIVAEAIAQSENLTHGSDASRVANIRDNRALEKQDRRASEVVRVGKPKAEPSHKAEVVPIKPKQAVDDGELGILDILGGEDDD